MIDFGLTVPWFLLTTVLAATSGCAKHRYDMNVANVISMHHIVCDGLCSRQIIAHGSRNALKKPSSGMAPEISDKVRGISRAASRT